MYRRLQPRCSTTFRGDDLAFMRQESSKVFITPSGFIILCYLFSYPDQGQGVRELSTESFTHCFPGCVIREFPACTRIPHREGNSEDDFLNRFQTMNKSHPLFKLELLCR